MKHQPRDHGGGVDAACRLYGGARTDWLDLSTGINPVPYPLPEFSTSDWTDLPDAAAMRDLLNAARCFWHVPESADIIAAPGASALIARLPYLVNGSNVCIQRPTYNEHQAAFQAAGWQVTQGLSDVTVVVHPNNPDGRLFAGFVPSNNKLLIIDESFCDVMPDQSHVDLAIRDDTIILKSFGKFWGLAGARLGFAIGAPALIKTMQDLLGPWPVAGPVLRLGTAALQDQNWAEQTRARLAKDAARLDDLMRKHRLEPLGGTDLFRLYRTENCTELFQHLAQNHILTRIFPYADDWLRLGLPANEADWARLETALTSSP